jgi:6-aminohexanoate-oligomer endohydrolase
MAEAIRLDGPCYPFALLPFTLISAPSLSGYFFGAISMPFLPRVLRCDAVRFALTSLFLSFLTMPLALSQDAAKAKPKPHVAYDGPALTFDFPGVKVGVAEYEEGPTGTTVLYFPTPVVAAVDVRGGAPGTVNTDGLRLAYDDPFTNAIVLSGGSSYGLSAATGVANALKDVIADSGNFDNVAVVAGAIIFDLGDRRFNTVTPDEELGRAALEAARAGWFPLGARGAGRFAMQQLGSEIPQHSGQGAAFRQFGDTKVLVVTVNNGGLVVDRKGQVMRCSHPVDGHCGSIADVIAAYLATLGKAKQARADFGNNQINPQGPTRHTTITIVVTNKSLPFWALERLGVQVHNSMTRGDQPMAEGDDGDTLFTVTTGKVVGATISDADMDDLGILASETAWDALLASLPQLPAKTPRTNIVLSPKELDSIIAGYAFSSDAIAEVRRNGTALEIELTGHTTSSSYFSVGKPVLLTPVATDEFEIVGPREDRLHIDRDAKGAIVGITLNPGPWAVHATRR